MAKKGGKSKGAVSAGVHSNVKRSTLNALRRDYMASSERIMNQLRAFRQRKNVMLTMENPNKNETNKPFVRVPASQVWKHI
jgi:F420-0:gamma-glutamyl ligase